MKMKEEQERLAAKKKRRAQQNENFGDGEISASILQTNTGNQSIMTSFSNQSQKSPKKEGGVSDAVRVAYLEKSLESFQKFHEIEMKEAKIRMENRMRTYAKGYLMQIKKAVMNDYKILCLQMDEMRVNEQKVKDRNQKLEKTILDQEKMIIEIKTWAKYDEIAHKRFSEELEDAGITKKMILDTRKE